MSFKLFKSTVVSGAMTTISRIFGLLRDIVIARVFGASAGLDVFIIAFRIPNFFRRLFAEGGFSQVFVPVLTEYKNLRSEDDVRALVGQTAVFLSTLLFAISLIGVFLSPFLFLIFAPGFIEDTEKIELGSKLLKITFPYILFISLVSLAGGILNTYKKFSVPAFTPVLLNLSLILCAILLAPNMQEPITALAWGVFIGGFVQLSFQIPFLLKINMLPRFGINQDIDGIKRILKLMVPILFSVSIVQINLLIDTVLASFLVTGSVSWLYFSDRLVEFPLGVFGIALATVILPNLSENHIRGSSKDFSRILDWALVFVFFITLPAAIGLIILAEPLLTTFFQYNEFTANDVNMAAKSLSAYAIGLPAFVLIKVLGNGFFSRQDTKTPVYIGGVSVIINLVLNLLLIGAFAHVGLALATSFSAIIQAFLLFLILRKREIYQPNKGWFLLMSKLFIATIIMFSVIYFMLNPISHWLAWSLFERVWHIAWLIFIGIFVYFSVLFILGLRLKNMISLPDNIKP